MYSELIKNRFKADLKQILKHLKDKKQTLKTLNYLQHIRAQLKLELLQAAGNEEDMTSLLELLVLRTAPSRDWLARTEILHSVIACLKESHRARTIFR